MAVFLRNISFHGILLDALFEPGNPDWTIVYDLVSEGIRNGVVLPLQTTLFEREDVESAFRYMSQGKHVGKVVIKVDSSSLILTSNMIPLSAVYVYYYGRIVNSKVGKRPL
jgi:hypothetical protein